MYACTGICLVHICLFDFVIECMWYTFCHFYFFNVSVVLNFTLTLVSDVSFQIMLIFFIKLSKLEMNFVSNAKPKHHFLLHVFFSYYSHYDSRICILYRLQPHMNYSANSVLIISLSNCNKQNSKSVSAVFLLDNL